jgi:prepilin-type processing-associated H-X9-DG protein
VYKRHGTGANYLFPDMHAEFSALYHTKGVSSVDSPWYHVDYDANNSNHKIFFWVQELF